MSVVSKCSPIPRFLVDCAGLHVTLEKILHDYDLVSTIREMNVNSGRATLAELPELTTEDGVSGKKSASSPVSLSDKCHETDKILGSNGNHAITA